MPGPFIDILDLIADGEFPKRSGTTLTGDGINELAADVANNAAAQAVLDARYGPGGTLDLIDTTLGDVRYGPGGTLDLVDTATGYARFMPGGGIWIPAQAFVAVVGAPSVSGSSGRRSAWLFDASADERVGVGYLFPAGWTTYHADLYWYNNGAGTGDVRWSLMAYQMADGADLSAGAPTEEPIVTAAAEAQNILDVVRVGSDLDVPVGLGSLVVRRRATDGTDTLANDAAFIGLLLTPVTEAAAEAQLDASGNLFNVLRHGALGDGTTDDTAAIEAAIDLVVAAGGGTVWFPPGKVFRYSSIAKVCSNVKFTGGGTLRSTLAKDSDTIAFNIVGDNVTVEGLTFDYVEPVDVPTDVFARGANGKTIRLGGARTGTFGYVDTTFWSSVLAVRNCTILDARNTAIDVFYGDSVQITGNTIRRSLGNGVFITNCLTDLRISGNSMVDLGDDGIFVACDADRPELTQGVIVTDNHIQLSDAKCIGFGGVDGGLIANNDCRESYASAIQLVQDTGLLNNKNVRIAGNYILDSGSVHGDRLHATAGTNGHGVEVNSYPSDIEVVGNVIVAPLRMGVRFTGGTRIGIRSNTVRDALGVGVRVGDPDDADFSEFTDLTIADNDIVGAVTGIMIGSGDYANVHHNKVRSFDSGSTGETRGIFYGYVRYSQIVGNLVINDDGADYGVRERPSSVNTGTTVADNVETAP